MTYLHYHYSQSQSSPSPSSDQLSFSSLCTNLITSLSSFNHTYTNSLRVDFNTTEGINAYFPHLIILYLLITKASGESHWSLLDILLNNFDMSEQIKLCRIITNYIDMDISTQFESIKGLQKLHMRITMIENKAKLKEQGLMEKISRLEKKIETMKNEDDDILSEINGNEMLLLQSPPVIRKKNDIRKGKEDIMNEVAYSPIRLSIQNDNENNKLTTETFSMDNLKTPSKYSQIKLTDQDYLKIILKKDFIIGQLKALLDERGERERESKRDREASSSKVKEDYCCKCEETASVYKKELDDFKTRYEMEFELMSSAMYNLGLSYLSYRENHLQQYHTNWLLKQKQQYFYNKEDRPEY